MAQFNGAGHLLLASFLDSAVEKEGHNKCLTKRRLKPTSNRYQGELRALLEVMLDHMECVARRPGARDELEEWWVVHRTYRQTLASP